MRSPALAGPWASALEKESMMRIGGWPIRPPTPSRRSLVVHEGYRVEKVSSPVDK